MMLKNIFVLIFLIFSAQVILSQDQNAPTNLEVEIATLGGVQLSWDHPAAFTREFVTQSNQSNMSPNFNYAIGSVYNGYHHFVFHKISGDSLSAYHGLILEKIAFKSGPDSAIFHAHVYAPEKGEEPDYIYKSDMVLTGPFVSLGDQNLTLNDWNYVNLTTFQPGITWENMVEPSTYQIDSTKDLWYGYYVRNFSGDPVGMDNGPANLGYGDIQVFCGGASVDSITCNPVSPNVNRNFLMALQLKSEDQTNDVDNYYVFQNGTIAEIVEPMYQSPLYSGRERVNFGPMTEGLHTFSIRALTSEGISDSTNNVTIDIVNSPPGPFDFVSPPDSASLSFEQSTLSSQVPFIWTSSVDPDGLELNYTVKICNSDTSLCMEQTLEERIYQPHVWMMMGQLSLEEGYNQLYWSVYASDGLDSTFANDSIYTFSVDLSNLSILESNPYPNDFKLNQNYPNPFNPTTNIKYEIIIGKLVKIEIYDLKGNFVKNLVNDYKMPGQYEVKWDGLDHLSKEVSAGVYIYTISSNSKALSKKMLFVK